MRRFQVRRPTGSALLLSGVIALTTLLFVAGVATEQAGLSPACAPSTAQPTHSEAGEGGASGEQHGAAACSPTESGAANGATERLERQQESVLGIPLEDPRVMTVIVLGWLLLIGAIVFVGRQAFLIVIPVAVLAAVFDVAEIALQLSRNRADIAVVALFVALGHAAIAVFALLEFRSTPPQPALTAPRL